MSFRVARSQSFWMLLTALVVGACGGDETGTDGSAPGGSGGAAGQSGGAGTAGDAGTGGAHLAVCGDGAIEGGETCDDSNTDDGDGCSAECTMEAGFGCDGQPSTCTPLCSDGLLRGDEQCDDENAVGGDGCSSDCRIESGFSCAGEPSACSPGCGDGLVVGSEQCDDGNTSDGDGCSASCSTESGYACVQEPSDCGPVCGDGLIIGGETCDDENDEAGDGCSSSCGQEVGWSCAGEPSKCDSDCGDGLVLGEEECDDSALLAGDGCDASCKTEPGWSCTGTPTSTCSSVCGDGLRVGGEQCDDGNLEEDDACSATCTLACGAPSMFTDPQTGQCYDVGSGLKTWQDARLACAAIGPGFDLFAPASSDEVIAVTASLVSAEPAGAQYWTGGSDAPEEGTWIWVNGEPWTYADGQPPWNTGEPSNSWGNENCAEFNVESAGTSAMNDVACDMLRGYVCERGSSSPICRNGILESPETCDDGNLLPGDGCDTFCRVEAGYECDGSPSICSSVCGDGFVRGAEQCDDDNADEGDGCSATCAIEAGYACVGEPSACTMSCGDGSLAPGEECDDENITPGDGCSATCLVEHAFTCVGTPSVCESTCGDGLVAADESCDDGNADATDGCNECQVTPGSSCGGEPSVCDDGVTVMLNNLALPIFDNAYDGTLESMSCVIMEFVGFAGLAVGPGSALEIAATHTYVGDLTIKLVSPNGKVATLLQRPAGDRSNPQGDEGQGCCGDDSDLQEAYPIAFDWSSQTGAETMGQGLSANETIGASGPASFGAMADQATDGGFADLQGEPIDGAWTLCFGDSEAYDIGSVSSATLRFGLE